MAYGIPSVTHSGGKASTDSAPPVNTPVNNYGITSVIHSAPVAKQPTQPAPTPAPQPGLFERIKTLATKTSLPGLPAPQSGSRTPVGATNYLNPKTVSPDKITKLNTQLQDPTFEAAKGAAQALTDTGSGAITNALSSFMGVAHSDQGQTAQQFKDTQDKLGTIAAKNQLSLQEHGFASNPTNNTSTGYKVGSFIGGVAPYLNPVTGSLVATEQLAGSRTPSQVAGNVVNLLLASGLAGKAIEPLMQNVNLVKNLSKMSALNMTGEDVARIGVDNLKNPMPETGNAFMNALKPANLAKAGVQGGTFSAAGAVGSGETDPKQIAKDFGTGVVVGAGIHTAVGGLTGLTQSLAESQTKTNTPTENNAFVPTDSSKPPPPTSPSGAPVPVAATPEPTVSMPDKTNQEPVVSQPANKGATINNLPKVGETAPTRVGTYEENLKAYRDIANKQASVNEPIYKPGNSYATKVAQDNTNALTPAYDRIKQLEAKVQSNTNLTSAESTERKFLQKNAMDTQKLTQAYQTGAFKDPSTVTSTPTPTTNDFKVSDNPQKFAQQRTDAKNNYQVLGKPELMGTTQPENAGLRILESQSNTPQGRVAARTELNQQIKSGAIKPNPDGTLTVYRGGEPNTKANLVSVSTDKAMAAEHGPVTEFTVKPADVAVANGLDKNELMVRKEGLPSNPAVEGVKPTVVESTPPTKVNGETVKVAPEKLPVGTGETKTSKLYDRYLETLKNVPEDQKQSVNYQVMNKKENVRAAMDQFSSGKLTPEDGMAILKGDKNPPAGIDHTSISIAMQELAKEHLSTGDTHLAMQLTSLSGTRKGQSISLYSEFDKYNAVNTATEINNARIEAHGGQDKITNEMKNTVTRAQKNSASTIKGSKAWANLLDKMVCQ